MAREAKPAIIFVDEASGILFRLCHLEVETSPCHSGNWKWTSAKLLAECCRHLMQSCVLLLQTSATHARILNTIPLT